MGIFDTQKMLCDTLIGDMTKNMNQLRTLDRATRSAIGAIENSLKDMSDLDNFTDFGDLQGAAGGILGQIDDAIPKIDMRDISRLLEECLALDKKFGDPTKALRSCIGDWGKMGKDWLHDMLDDLFPEFGLSGKISDLYGGIGKAFKSLIQSMDEMLDCLASVCAIDANNNPIQDVIDHVDNFSEGMNDSLTNMHLDDMGNFDMDHLMSASGLNDVQRSGMRLAAETERTVETAFETAGINALEKAEEEYNAGRNPGPVSGVGSGNLGRKTTVMTDHYNDPSIVSMSEFYNQLNPSGEWMTDWNEVELPAGQTQKVGVLNVTIELINFDIEEIPEPDINCYSIYTAEVNVTIGTVSKTKIIELPKSMYVCRSCGYYQVSQFNNCYDEDFKKIRKFSSEVISKAVKSAISMFTNEEIENQLSDR